MSYSPDTFLIPECIQMREAIKARLREQINLYWRIEGLGPDRQCAEGIEAMRSALAKLGEDDTGIEDGEWPPAPVPAERRVSRARTVEVVGV